MSRYSYNSQIKNSIESFLEHKHSLGYDYKMGEYWLHVFDQFISKEYPGENMLSKEIVLHWLQKRHGEHINNVQGRMHYIRQLSLFMNQIGIDTFVVPEDYSRKLIRYVPHVFTDQELTELFYAVDGISFRKSNPSRSIVMPVLFRLLYCCGLRPSEAIHLKTDDVDLNMGKLLIRQSKGNKDRVVPLSSDILNLFLKYESQIGMLWPNREWFFPNHIGVPYTPSYISFLFQRFWRLTKITVSGNAPRLYDLRHSFCVKRLNLWVQENRDLQAYLPYLSMYMGHSSLSKTDYYLHLVPDFFPEILKKSAYISDEVIPEVTE